MWRVRHWFDQLVPTQLQSPAVYPTASVVGCQQYIASMTASNEGHVTHGRFIRPSCAKWWEQMLNYWKAFLSPVSLFSSHELCWDRQKQARMSHLTYTPGFLNESPGGRCTCIREGEYSVLRLPPA